MSLLSRPVPLSQLADFCDRFGTSLQAGVDPRRALDGELGRVGRSLRPALQTVRDEIETGSTLGDAFAQTGNAFPPIFHELLAVGEETGKVDQMLLRQANHYRHLRNLRWLMVSLTAWPMIQLSAAVVLIGVFIVLLGTLVPGKMDILGFGLVGWKGLAKYVSFLLVVAAVLTTIGWFVFNPSRRALLKSLLGQLPALSGYFTADAMARLCWTLSIVEDAGMDLRRGLRAALRSTENQRYIAPTDEIVADVGRGQTLAQSFGRTKVFPYELIAALEVGEQSGTLSETLNRLSDQYRKQAEAKSVVLTTALSFVIWAMVAMVIIFMIFSIANFIFGTYRDLADPNQR